MYLRRILRLIKHSISIVANFQCRRMSSSSDGSSALINGGDSLVSSEKPSPSTRWTRFYFLGFALFFLYGVSIWILLKFVQYSVSNQQVFPFFHSADDLLDRIHLNCEGLLRSDPSAIKESHSWRFNPNPVEEEILEAEDKCAVFKNLFSFRDSPLSEEEREYPLAYGLVVYKQIVQVLFMISSFYHPQNEYCVAVSGSAKPHFKVVLRQLASCFPNIHVMERPPITWGSFEIINSTYSCMEYLSSLESKWEYFQYLSGVDVPIRTNREMVEIFKVFNGTVNLEFKPYQPGRARTRNATEAPLPLYKSSLSAIIPRSAADFIANSNVTRELLHFLRSQAIPDEAFWATLTGNNEEYPVPGGFSAQDIIDFREKMDGAKRKSLETGFAFNATKWRYYLSRYQLWTTSGCGGKMSSGSCIFGVKDLGTVMKQPHLVAHKFYIDFQPAAYFCALKEIKRRSLNPVSFDTKFYSQLPQIELQNGISFENLSHPNWLV